MAEGKQSKERTLERRIALLDRLPASEQQGLTTDELHQYLRANGFNDTRRTVERDLEAIREKEPVWKWIGVELTSERVSEAQATRWRHAPQSKAVMFRSLSDEQAMLLSLMEQELQFFMPATTYQAMQPYFERSRAALARPTNERKRHFKERIRVLPEGPQLQAPNVMMDHLREINEALVNEEQLAMTYRRTKDNAIGSYRLHPIGLVKQGLFFWLLAVKDESLSARPLLEEVRRFRLDRIQTVTRRQQDPIGKGLPGLDQIIAEGKMGFFPGEPIKLRLRFAACPGGQQLCNNYRDTPLASDQQIVQAHDGTTELTATVHYSLQLVWMLQGVAHRVRVMEPPELRNTIARFVAEAAALQGDTV